ncbi:hypothetical protein [Streptomyces sp. NPDC048606]|uniref:hypothetical protein n=1 Tax=Streptomyces sp. NPDC048606 TaxID=3154726 RepID=UPI00342482FC
MSDTRHTQHTPHTPHTRNPDPAAPRHRGDTESPWRDFADVTRRMERLLERASGRSDPAEGAGEPTAGGGTA